MIEIKKNIDTNADGRIQSKEMVNFIKEEKNISELKNSLSNSTEFKKELTEPMNIAIDAIIKGKINADGSIKLDLQDDKEEITLNQVQLKQVMNACKELFPELYEKVNNRFANLNLSIDGTFKRIDEIIERSSTSLTKKLEQSEKNSLNQIKPILERRINLMDEYIQKTKNLGIDTTNMENKYKEIQLKYNNILIGVGKYQGAAEAFKKDGELEGLKQSKENIKNVINKMSANNIIDYVQEMHENIKNGMAKGILKNDLKEAKDSYDEYTKEIHQLAFKKLQDLTGNDIKTNYKYFIDLINVINGRQQVKTVESSDGSEDEFKSNDIRLEYKDKKLTNDIMMFLMNQKGGLIESLNNMKKKEFVDPKLEGKEDQIRNIYNETIIFKLPFDDPAQKDKSYNLYSILGFTQIPDIKNKKYHDLSAEEKVKVGCLIRMQEKLGEGKGKELVDKMNTFKELKEKHKKANEKFDALNKKLGLDKQKPESAENKGSENKGESKESNNTDFSNIGLLENQLQNLENKISELETLATKESDGNLKIGKKSKEAILSDPNFQKKYSEICGLKSNCDRGVTTITNTLYSEFGNFTKETGQAAQQEVLHAITHKLDKLNYKELIEKGNLPLEGWNKDVLKLLIEKEGIGSLLSFNSKDRLEGMTDMAIMIGTGIAVGAVLMPLAPVVLGGGMAGMMVMGAATGLITAGTNILISEHEWKTVEEAVKDIGTDLVVNTIMGGLSAGMGAKLAGMSLKQALAKNILTSGTKKISAELAEKIAEKAIAEHISKIGFKELTKLAVNNIGTTAKVLARAQAVEGLDFAMGTFAEYGRQKAIGQETNLEAMFVDGFNMMIVGKLAGKIAERPTKFVSENIGKVAQGKTHGEAPKTQPKSLEEFKIKPEHQNLLERMGLVDEYNTGKITKEEFKVCAESVEDTIKVMEKHGFKFENGEPSVGKTPEHKTKPVDTHTEKPVSEPKIHSDFDSTHTRAVGENMLYNPENGKYVDIKTGKIYENGLIKPNQYGPTKEIGVVDPKDLTTLQQKHKELFEKQSNKLHQDQQETVKNINKSKVESETKTPQDIGKKDGADRTHYGENINQKINKIDNNKQRQAEAEIVNLNEYKKQKQQKNETQDTKPGIEDSSLYKSKIIDNLPDNQLAGINTKGEISFNQKHLEKNIKEKFGIKEITQTPDGKFLFDNQPFNKLPIETRKGIIKEMEILKTHEVTHRVLETHGITEMTLNGKKFSQEDISNILDGTLKVDKDGKLLTVEDYKALENQIQLRISKDIKILNADGSLDQKSIRKFDTKEIVNKDQDAFVRGKVAAKSGFDYNPTIKFEGQKINLDSLSTRNIEIQGKNTLNLKEGQILKLSNDTGNSAYLIREGNDFYISGDPGGKTKYKIDEKSKKFHIGGKDLEIGLDTKGLFNKKFEGVKINTSDNLKVNDFYNESKIQSLSDLSFHIEKQGNSDIKALIDQVANGEMNILDFNKIASQKGIRGTNGEALGLTMSKILGELYSNPIVLQQKINNCQDAKQLLLLINNMGGMESMTGRKITGQEFKDIFNGLGSGQTKINDFPLELQNKIMEFLGKPRQEIPEAKSRPHEQFDEHGLPKYEAPKNRNTERMEIHEVPRSHDVMAIGDQHGNYEAFKKTMEDTGLIDKNGKWIGGDKKLVFNGDILGDRHAGGVDILAKINELRKQGADIRIQAGNHDMEFLNPLLGKDVGISASQAYGLIEYAQFSSNPKIKEFANKYANNKKYSQEEFHGFIDEVKKNKNEILSNMQKSPKGKAFLEEVSRMEVCQQVDDGIYLHTNPTDSMLQEIKIRAEKNGGDIGKAVDEINKAYQEGLKAKLLGGNQGNNMFDNINDKFLHTMNGRGEGRFESTNENLYKYFKDRGINRFVHGHDDEGLNHGAKEHAGVQIVSTDTGYGKQKNHEGNGKATFEISKKDGQMTAGNEVKAKPQESENNTHSEAPKQHIDAPQAKEHVSNKGPESINKCNSWEDLNAYLNKIDGITNSSGEFYPKEYLQGLINDYRVGKDIIVDGEKVLNKDILGMITSTDGLRQKVKGLVANEKPQQSKHSEAPKQHIDEPQVKEHIDKGNVEYKVNQEVIIQRSDKSLQKAKIIGTKGDKYTVQFEAEGGAGTKTLTKEQLDTAMQLHKDKSEKNIINNANNVEFGSEKVDRSVAMKRIHNMENKAKYNNDIPQELKHLNPPPEAWIGQDGKVVINSDYIKERFNIKEITEVDGKMRFDGKTLNEFMTEGGKDIIFSENGKSLTLKQYIKGLKYHEKTHAIVHEIFNGENQITVKIKENQNEKIYNTFCA